MRLKIRLNHWYVALIISMFFILNVLPARAYNLNGCSIPNDTLTLESSDGACFSPQAYDNECPPGYPHPVVKLLSYQPNSQCQKDNPGFGYLVVTAYTLPSIYPRWGIENRYCDSLIHIQEGYKYLYTDSSFDIRCVNGQGIPTPSESVTPTPTTSPKPSVTPIPASTPSPTPYSDNPESPSDQNGADTTTSNDSSTSIKDKANIPIVQDGAPQDTLSPYCPGHRLSSKSRDRNYVACAHRFRTFWQNSRFWVRIHQNLFIKNDHWK